MSSVVDSLAHPDSIAGEWEVVIDRLEGTLRDYMRVTLEVHDDRLTGSLFGLTIDGTLVGTLVEFRLLDNSGRQHGKLNGMVEGDRLSGNGGIDETEPFEWEARRSIRTSSSLPR